MQVKWQTLALLNTTGHASVIRERCLKWCKYSIPHLQSLREYLHCIVKKNSKVNDKISVSVNSLASP